MVSSLTFRTDDFTRWGAGQGSDLAANVIDLDFWNLFSAVEALEDAQSVSAGIDFIVMQGNQLFVHLTDHRVLGPFTVPATVWNPRGEWQPLTNYFPLDVVSHNGQLFVVNVSHTSASTFSVLATDGQGHALYTLLLDNPANALPDNGTPGQRLAKASDSPFVTEWVSDLVRMALFIGGQPSAGELVLQYVATDSFTFPIGLAGSAAFSAANASTPSTFQINKNGAPIGQIVFGPSPLVDVEFPAQISIVPGDVIAIVAPSIQDPTLADISLSLVGQLGL